MLQLEKFFFLHLKIQAPQRYEGHRCQRKSKLNDPTLHNAEECR